MSQSQLCRSRAGDQRAGPCVWKSFGFRASEVNQEQIICRVTEASENSPMVDDGATSTSTGSVSYRFESLKQAEKAGTCWFILRDALNLSAVWF